MSTEKSPLVPHPPLQEHYATESERRQFISTLFDETASEYDWITWAMSLGSGQWYRTQALLRAGLTQGMQVLDIAVGSGQVAKLAVSLTGPSGLVIGLDRSFNMLKEAEKNVSIPLVRASAEQLPFADNTFDFLSMGYALRHVDDLHQTFREYLRVLKPKGILLILELTKPQSRPLYWCTRMYLEHLIPVLVRLKTGKRQSAILIKYLWNTIDHCVAPTDILDAIIASGFVHTHRRQQWGFFSEYTAIKAEESK